MVNLKIETQIQQDFMKYLYKNKIKVNFCLLAAENRKFEICITKRHELQQKELEDLALLLKFNINLSEKQICFKVFKQKVKLTNKSIVHHYIFCGFFI